MSKVRKVASLFFGSIAAGSSYALYQSNQTFNPYIDNYDETKDDEFQKAKKEYLSKTKPGSFDEVMVTHMHRMPTGQLCKLEWINNNSGLPLVWNDSDTKQVLKAIVRADGKILSEIKPMISRCTYYDEKSVRKAKVVDGYLVGLENNGYYFSGKGTYPVYQYDK